MGPDENVYKESDNRALVIHPCLCDHHELPITIKRKSATGDGYTEYRNGWALLDQSLNKSKGTDIMEIYSGSLKSYARQANGLYVEGANTYKYCLEICGTMPNASKESTFVYLSNMEEISFDRAWKAAGLSSNSADYFDEKDAVLVDIY